MRLVKPVVVCLSAAVLISLVGCGAPQKFDESKYSTSSSTGGTTSSSLTADSKASSTTAASSSATAAGTTPVPASVPGASSHWKKEGWWSMPKNAGNKIAIVEFTVDYVTSRDKVLGKNQLNLMTVARVAGVGRREYNFDESLKTSLPDQLYAEFVNKLQAQGYEVVSMDEVAAAIERAEMVEGKAGVKKGGTYYHGFLSGGGKQKVQIYPVSGLPRLYDGFFTFGKNARAMGNVMGDLGAGTALRVHMRLGLHNGKATAEAGSSIDVFTGLESYELSGKKNYYCKTFGKIQGHNTLYYDSPVVDEKRFEAFKGNVWDVNSEDYAAAIRKFYPTYAAMGLSFLK